MIFVHNYFKEFNGFRTLKVIFWYWLLEDDQLGLVNFVLILKKRKCKCCWQIYFLDKYWTKLHGAPHDPSFVLSQENLTLVFISIFCLHISIFLEIKEKQSGGTVDWPSKRQTTNLVGLFWLPAGCWIPNLRKPLVLWSSP